MDPNRRSFLKWVGITPIGGTLFRLPRDPDLTSPFEEHYAQSDAESVAQGETVHQPTRRSLSWVQKRLKKYYGSRFYKQPTRGIFHHYPDQTYDLLRKDAFLQLAQTYQPLLVSGHEERFDCDEYATGLRWMFLTGGLGEFPASNMVGIAHNFAGSHVYNVVICAEGEILEWEPQSNTLVSESGGPPEYYNFKSGILYL
ncbi:hypothetical protein SAMN04487950_0374 [Halogranum rubrum]|uniref:Agglutinin C-terminal domain-containing protein n=1 Tax=Halogranum rubrum TaxID=553466 RepID=A0A1I4B9M3_9EURY|nr:hypothetical protein SAMN04487950_0374 [Halogranum rubrum]